MPSRLKSLELHGYKTFASRTQFEFPGMVTAVVGPNGSGKSNIADSIRWVLGEQSFSLLRGRKTEDMIFAGSEHRPRAGMASATITFDNGDGWLPIDYSEVAITRRAYRDGQNEYLLNGQKVRLKEISELLAQSGLAERTYTIIGQGLVDSALALKPEERRKFFEEAAGIGLYRSRREDSINRLQDTRRNLERVLDILSELEPRMHSLEKQAKRAQEFERIRSDLRLLLRDWYGFHWHRIQQELLHARDVLKAQEARLAQTRQHQTEVEAELTHQREALQRLRQRLNDWHAQSSELHRQREALSRTLAVMDERQRALAEQQNSLQSDLARMEEEQKSREERLAEISAERDRLAGELKEAEGQVREARKAMEARQEERARMEAQIRELRRTQSQSENKQVQIKAHLRELENRVESLQRNQKSLAQSIEGERQALVRAKEKVTLAEQARQESDAAQKAADEGLVGLRRDAAAFETRRKQALDERSKEESELSRLKTQLEVLEQAERSLTGLATGAKTVLQEARNGKLKGGFKALISQLVVPAHIETAIEAALGDALDTVLLERGVDLEDVLSLLTSGERGRAVLLPLDDINDEGIDGNWQGREGVLGVAEKLVQAPKDIQPAVRALLGRTIIVRDRQTAQNWLHELPDRAQAVTLRGEVFWSHGPVVAGREKAGASAVGRARRMQELREEMDAVEEHLGELRQTFMRADQALQQARQQEREQENTLRSAGQVLARATQTYQAAVLELEQARQKHDYQSKQMATVESQLQKAAQEISQAKADGEAAEKKTEELNEKVREANRELARLPLEELQSQVVHWNTSVAVAGRAVSDADRRLREAQEAIQSARSLQGNVRRRMEENQVTLDRLENEKATLRGQESGFNEEIESLRLQIEPSEAELDSLEKTYNQQQDAVLSAQQATSVAERYATQAQLDVTRQKESMDSMRRRIEEDFGLVAFEYNPEVSGPTPLPLDGMVEQLPRVDELAPEIEDNINRQRAQLRRMGPINPEVQKEFEDVRERFDFLTEQVSDLKQADSDLRQVITELDELMKVEFRRTFDAVAREFTHMFTRLFGGGTARLLMTDEDRPNESGIDIEARLPGRREQGLSLLSGGERSLTAVALVCSLIKVSPTPFCVMDEVDAMLDEANVGRYRDLLVELSNRTQFILVTHNRNTVQAADVIYGITMGRDSASQVISLKLDEVGEDMVK